MIIDARHGDKTGEISRKHGNTLVSTLRRIYGDTFATGKPTRPSLVTCLLGFTKRPRPSLCRTMPLATLTKQIRKAALTWVTWRTTARFRFLAGAQ